MVAKRLTRNQIWIILGLVIVGIVILRFKFGGSENEASSYYFPTVVPTPRPTMVTFDEKEYPLWKLLPYSSPKGFVVEKYLSPKTILVKSNGLSGVLTTKLVLEWLKEQGSAGNNHKIVLE